MSSIIVFYFNGNFLNSIIESSILLNLARGTFFICNFRFQVILKSFNILNIVRGLTDFYES